VLPEPGFPSGLETVHTGGQIMIEILQKIFTGSILFVLFSVLSVLAFGPVYLEFRTWYRQKKADEYEQKHGFKPRKKHNTGGHF
jgi:hypothetical protein